MTPSEPWAAAIVSLAATYLLHSTACLLAVWLLLAAVRSRSAALQERLWRFALLAPLATAPLHVAGVLPGRAVAIGGRPSAALPEPRFTSPSDPRAFVEPAPREPATPSLAPALPTITPSPGPTIPAPTIPAPPTPAAPSALPQSASVPPVFEPTPRTAPPAAAFAVSELQLLAAAVAGAALLGLLRVTVLCARLTSLLRGTQPAPAAAARALDQVRRRRRVRRQVRLVTSAAVREPSACGVWRWTIVLPADTGRLSNAGLQALLSHELAHLVRRDTLWLLLTHVACWCAPYQPLNWLARRRWRQASECMADDWAVALGASRLELAKSLTEVAQWRLGEPAAAIAAGAGSGAVTRRVERLLADRQLPDRWTAAAWRRGLTLLLLAVLLGASRALWLSLRSEARAADHPDPPPLLSPEAAAPSGANQLPDDDGSLAHDLRGLQQDLDRLAALLSVEHATAAALAEPLRRRSQLLIDHTHHYLSRDRASAGPGQLNAKELP